MVLEEHSRHRAIFFLRLEARRLRGEKLSDELQRRLDNWKAQLKELNAVVYYDPESVDGFYYVHREPGDTELFRPPAEATSHAGLAGADQ